MHNILLSAPDGLLCYLTSTPVHLPENPTVQSDEAAKVRMEHVDWI